MKFKYATKGFISQGFEDNQIGAYVDQGLTGHTGVDSTQGYGKLIRFDNPGCIYKVWKPQEREDNWAAIYQLVPFGNDFMEVTIGHCSAIYVQEGETVLEGQYAGKEGNLGLVFQNGIQITPEMQDAGDKRGSHVHEQYRPVKRVRVITKGKHYLNNKSGRYKDKEGYYYEIVHKNGVTGCINPRTFDYVDTRADKLRCLTNALLTIKL